MPLADPFDIVRALVRNCAHFCHAYLLKLQPPAKSLSSFSNPRPERSGCTKHLPREQADTLNAARPFPFSRGFLLCRGFRTPAPQPRSLFEHLAGRRPKT